MEAEFDTLDKDDKGEIAERIVAMNDICPASSPVSFGQVRRTTSEFLA
jgi:hypothetical protein